MVDGANVQRYLEVMAYEQQRAGGPDARVGRFPFVTISRQTGAGGHSLAQALLQAMSREREPLFHGWQMFDQELCRVLMEDPKLRVSLQSLLTEAYRSQLEDVLCHLVLGDSPQSVVVQTTFRTLRTLATMGKVVLVGRGGACVTRGLPFGVHVRLVASEASRIARMARLFELTDTEALRLIRRQDQDRARLVAEAFHKDIDDPLLYDAVWNTDAVSVETIADALLVLIRAKQPAGAPLR
jgi:hypothetical protein